MTWTHLHMEVVWDCDRPVKKIWTVRMFGQTDWCNISLKHFLTSQMTEKTCFLWTLPYLWSIPKFVFVQKLWIPYCLINKKTAFHWTFLWNYCCMIFQFEAKMTVCKISPNIPLRSRLDVDRARLACKVCRCRLFPSWPEYKLSLFFFFLNLFVKMI